MGRFFVNVPATLLNMLLADKLKNINVILGSASPRRKELLGYLDIDFTVDATSNTPEVVDPLLPLLQVAPSLSRQKSEGFHRPLLQNELLITADTVVICKNRILGKPKDAVQASEMLHLLSGCTHQVCTGVTLRTKTSVDTFSAVTRVTFRDLSEHEIDYYIGHYKPFDKAGSYGIQEWIGAIGIVGIEGSFYNVMGLPVQALHTHLLDMV